MKPICVPCQRFFRMKKAGYYFIEQMPRDGDQVVPGKKTPERWKPYKLWVGDLWRCPDCGAEIVGGVALAPVAEHYQPEFDDKVLASGAKQLTVNDC